MLFPMINQGVGRGAAMPISVMMHEHEEHDQAIARLEELTNNFELPEGACGSWTRLYSVNASKNPATTETTFIVTHNYIGSDVDIDIEVFDMSGRLLWHRSETGVASGNAITANWDLTVESGARLKTGVYLYRVRLSSDGATKVSKAKKLIILDNK